MGRAHPHSLPSPAIAVTFLSRSADRCECCRSMTPFVVSISIVSSLIASSHELLYPSATHRSYFSSGARCCGPCCRSVWSTLEIRLHYAPRGVFRSRVPQLYEIRTFSFDQRQTLVIGKRLRGSNHRTSFPQRGSRTSPR